jgi:hypothetical protein
MSHDSESESESNGQPGLSGMRNMMFIVPPSSGYTVGEQPADNGVARIDIDTDSDPDADKP